MKMTDFGRELQLNHIEELERLATSEAQNWWKDLLKYWRPAGEPAGDFGLRLAVRKNYLNFYRKGQSVAKVDFNSDGNACVSVHLKYLGQTDVKKGKEYARLQGETFASAIASQGIKFGVDTIEEIIEKTEKHVGTEKNFVDKAFADNSNAIDLEITLPKQPGSIGAPRMDLAILEKNPASGQVELVFWEAKTIDDSRLTSKDPEPEVVRQLKKYEDMMTEPATQTNVATQYQKTCILLTTLAKMASRCNNEVILGELVTATAKGGTLAIDPKPRLVIFEGNSVKNGKPLPKVKNWPEHQRKLTEDCKVLLHAPFSSQPFALKKW